MKFNERIRSEYIGRINKVIDFIENNLNEDLNLDQLSQIACFSPYHFHRIFSVFVGETLNSYITRKKIEKIAYAIINGSEMSMTELAFRFGFNTDTSFSRSFKKFYCISPTEFKAGSKE